LEAKAKRLSKEAKEDKSKQRTLERELEWMRQGAKARQAKSKARISAYNDLANQSERVSCLSNSTSQPALGTLDALFGANSDMLPDKELYGKVDEYWQQARALYKPFETGTMASATDVYLHEMPGGQVTNLRFQAVAVGLGDRWDDVKKGYAAANRALGDIVKVTPSSKVVGDLALFMV
jgi:pyruvate carboxylase